MTSKILLIFVAEEEKDRYSRSFDFTSRYMYLFSIRLLLYVCDMELLAVSSILYFVPGIYAHVVGAWCWNMYSCVFLRLFNLYNRELGTHTLPGHLCLHLQHSTIGNGK